MQVELLGGQDGDVRPFGAADFAGDECRHLSPARVWPTASSGSGWTAWGFARSSFYAMKSRQQATAERPPAKRRGPKPSISDEALLVAIEAQLEASALGGRGTPRGLGSKASGLSWHPCFPTSGCSGWCATNNRARRPIAAAAVSGNPHVGGIIAHAPNLMMGPRTAFGCSRWTTAGAGYSPPFRALERRVRGKMACVQARRPLRRGFSRSPWGLRAR